MGHRTPDGGWATDLEPFARTEQSLAETEEVADSVCDKLRQIGVSAEHLDTARNWIWEALAEGWERGYLAAPLCGDE